MVCLADAQLQRVLPGRSHQHQQVLLGMLLVPLFLMCLTDSLERFSAWSGMACRMMHTSNMHTSTQVQWEDGQRVDMPLMDVEQCASEEFVTSSWMPPEITEWQKATAALPCCPVLQHALYTAPLPRRSCQPLSHVQVIAAGD